MSTIRWLHISDLHLQENQNAEWNLLQNHLPFPPIKFLVFTGDLHQFGQSYEKSLEFLRHLMKQYKLSINDVFIVPGNHDVDEDSSINWSTFAHKRLSEISNTVADVRDKDGKPLTNRFLQYCSAVQRLKCGKGIAYPWSEIFCCDWRKKINIIHLNTALLSCEETQLQQIIDTTALAALKPEYPELPAIVLAHHNFYRLSDAQYNIINKCFSDLNVRAYLHGDIHMNREEPILLDSGRRIPCIAAPSIYRNPTDTYTKTGAYLYEWDLDSPQGKVTVVPYQWQDLELKRGTSIIESFDMQKIEKGLWQTYRERADSLDPGMLPGIVYDSCGADSMQKEYKNLGDSSEQPMIQLLQEHSDERYFQLTGNGKQSCGGTGKTSTLLSVAAALTSPNWKRQQLIPLYFSLKELYGLTKTKQKTDNRLMDAATKAYQIEWENPHPVLLFLLDGFNEISSPKGRTNCLKDIRQLITDYPKDAIIITSRDPLSTYINLGECSEAFDYDQLNEWSVYFRNCYVQALTKEQKDKYIGEPKPAPDDQIWCILDTPFYLARYNDTKIELRNTARRWLTPALERHLQGARSNKVTLMLQLVLRDIDRLHSGVTADEAEHQCFFLMKVLPFVGYQQVLTDRLDDALSNGPKLRFGKKDIYRYTYNCLCAYMDRRDLWPEYSGSYADSLEMCWGKFCELYERNGKPPTVTALNELVPYSTFLFGLLVHRNGVSQFCHDNYRDFFAALHIANVVYLLSVGFSCSALKNEELEVFLLQLEVFDHSILIDAETILEQYFGICLNDKSCFETLLCYAQGQLSRLILLHILIRFLEANAQSNSRRFGNGSDKQLFIYQSGLYVQFKELFESLQQSPERLGDRYGQFYVYVLAMLARDYRTGKSGNRSLIQCVSYAHLAVESSKKLNIPKADGYLQLGLCMNAYMEDLLNGQETDFDLRLPYNSPALAEKIARAVREYTKSKDETVIRELMRPLLGKRCSYTPDTLNCSDIYNMILQCASEKYAQAEHTHYKKIAELGFISKAYLVLAALGTSGGAFNTLAQMLFNQANQYESDPRLPFFQENQEVDPHKGNQNLTYHLNQDSNLVLGFRLLLVVCNIRRGNQPYSHSKAAELILKGHVAIRTDVNGSLIVSDNAAGIYLCDSDSWVESALNKAISGDNDMAYYWKGRYYLKRADTCANSALKDEYRKMAIDCFQATKATDFSYQSYLDGNCPLPLVQWLSAMELLAFPEEVSFLSERDQIYQAIYQCLSKQVELVKKKQLKLENEKYRLMKQDVLGNLRRFYVISTGCFEVSYISRIEELMCQLNPFKLE